MGIFGNEDMGPSLEDNDRLAKILEEHGKEFEVHGYDGDGHAFWCYDQDKYRHAQCIDA